MRLAKIQQVIQAKTKSKARNSTGLSRNSISSTMRGDQKLQGTSQWSKERQLRDYCRANNLCFFCREPYDANHAAKCTKRPKAQVNALCLNNLDIQLTDEVLAQLDIEYALAEEFGTLSLNAIAGTEEGEAFRIRALVKNKVMLMLVDSGSSHSFISSDFLSTVGIQPEAAAPKQVRVANGETLISTHCMPAMEWWTQGNSFTANMRVLDLKAYDAIIGYDWLKAHSPILHDWDNRTMEFSHKGNVVMLKGVPPPDMSLTPLPVERLMKWLAGNDVWALAVVETAPLFSSVPTDQVLPEVQSLLDEFSDVFEEPAQLPPQRVHDHAIPTLPNSIPVNSKPYREHKLFMKMSKCTFAQQQLEYLGHIISDKGVAIDPTKTEAMLQAFETLKLAMSTTPVLALPDFTIPFIVETDASDVGIGVVLMQKEQPVAFLSKTL